MKRQHWCFHGVFALTCFVAIGCGGSGDEGPVVVPVVGKVTVDGEVIQGAGVSFRPDTEKGNSAEFMPAGATDAEGKYELMATASKKGAPPGWYKVVVMPPSAPPGSDVVITFPEYNAKYMKPEETDLSFEVKEGTDDAPQVIDIQLTK